MGEHANDHDQHNALGRDDKPLRQEGRMLRMSVRFAAQGSGTIR